MYFLFSYFIKVKCQRSVFKNVGVHSVHVLYIFYFAATELGHVYVTGSDDQISLVQQNHTHSAESHPFILRPKDQKCDPYKEAQH